MTSTWRRGSRSSCGAAFRTMQLLDAATRGTLSTPAVLEQQVKRMLADRRSEALIDNFVSQWLTLNKLAGVVPDVDAYPEFDENLRDAFRQETRLFVQAQLREDRSVGELLTANYTYVNERLARHYQIPNVYGSHFRRVDVRRWQARGTARTRQHPDRHVVPESHVAGAARAMAARQRPRGAATAAAAGRSDAEGRIDRASAIDPRTDGSAPQEPVVRGVPRPHGSARLLARELRCAGQVAHLSRCAPG